MKPAIRTQVDDLHDLVSLQTSIDCSDLPDMTRQEFKDEADVNKILARFGANTPIRQTIYGEIDYDLDLQQSLTAISNAQDACRKLPEPLRQKYYHWQMLLEGMRSGQFRNDLDAHLAQEKKRKDLTNKEDPAILQEPSNKE